MLAMILPMALAACNEEPSPPFGIDIRTATPSSLGCPDYGGGLFNRCDDLPESEPLLEFRSIQYIEGVGFCRIFAQTEVVDTGPEGREIRKLADRVAARLARRFGPATKQDRNLRDPFGPDEITDEWVNELDGNRRFYSYSFDSPDPSTGILSVYADAEMKINRDSYRFGFIDVIFTVSEDAACELKQ